MPIITFQGKTKHLLNRCLLLGLYRKCNLRSVFQQRFSVSIYIRSTRPWLGMMMIRMSDDYDEKPDMWPWLGTHTEARRSPMGTWARHQTHLSITITPMSLTHWKWRAPPGIEPGSQRLSAYPPNHKTIRSRLKVRWSHWTPWHSSHNPIIFWWLELLNQRSPRG